MDLASSSFCRSSLFLPPIVAKPMETVNTVSSVSGSETISISPLFLLQRVSLWSPCCGVHWKRRVPTFFNSWFFNTWLLSWSQPLIHPHRTRLYRRQHGDHRHITCRKYLPWLQCTLPQLHKCMSSWHQNMNPPAYWTPRERSFAWMFTEAFIKSFTEAFVRSISIKFFHEIDMHMLIGCHSLRERQKPSGHLVGRPEQPYCVNLGQIATQSVRKRQWWKTRKSSAMSLYELEPPRKSGEKKPPILRQENKSFTCQEIGHLT